MPSKTAQTTQNNADVIGADGIPNVDYPETAEQRAKRGAAIAAHDADMSTGGELAKPQKRLFDDTQLAGMTTFAEAAAAVSSVMDVESFADYGNGFKVLDAKDKRRLVDVPFLIIEWRFNKSTDYEGGFVSFTCVTKNDERLIVNDGSTGIYRQLLSATEAMQAKGRPVTQGGLLVPRGLRESTYDNPNGQGKATTYYLSTDKD